MIGTEWHFSFAAMIWVRTFPLSRKFVQRCAAAAAAAVVNPISAVYPIRGVLSVPNPCKFGVREPQMPSIAPDRE